MGLDPLAAGALHGSEQAIALRIVSLSFGHSDLVALGSLDPAWRCNRGRSSRVIVHPPVTGSIEQLHGSRYGGRGLGGVLGLVLVVALVIWVLGGLHFNPA
jgi:hypothetical protein